MTDGNDEGDIFGAIDSSTTVNLGDPDNVFIAEVEDGKEDDLDHISDLLHLNVRIAGGIQLFSEDISVWKFITNQGIATDANVLNFRSGITIDQNVRTEGEVPSLDLSLSENIRTRDLISIQGDSEFRQVIEVQSKFIQVKEVSNSSGYNFGQFKRIEYISDSTQVTVDCFGITEDGTATGDWIKTPSQIINNLISEQLASSRINSDSFDNAALFSNITGSLYIPYSIDENSTKNIRFS